MIRMQPRLVPGSSPLARGLHIPARVLAIAEGIIPARAGFTDMAVGISNLPTGSSPLARGLQE